MVAAESAREPFRKRELDSFEPREHEQRDTHERSSPRRSSETSALVRIRFRDARDQGTNVTL